MTDARNCVSSPSALLIMAKHNGHVHSLYFETTFWGRFKATTVIWKYFRRGDCGVDWALLTELMGRIWAQGT